MEVARSFKPQVRPARFVQVPRSALRKIYAGQAEKVGAIFPQNQVKAFDFWEYPLIER